MVWFIGQSIVFILLAFLLGIIVGRLTMRRDTRLKSVPAATTELPEMVTSSNPVKTGARPSGEKPELPVRPKPSPRKATAEKPVPDDELERIEGIGPKMADALRAAGIRTFAQLADADDDTKRRAVHAAGMSFAPSLVTWSRQARLLADGDEEAFAELTARLIAGRDTEVAR